MNNTAWLLDTDGSKKEVLPKDGKEFTLDELYELLGTDNVEQLATNDREMCMLVDEDAKMKGEPINYQATKLMHVIYQADDCVVGKVLYCPRELFS